MRPKLGDRVQGQYEGQSGGRNWFDGVVTAVHEDGTCDLHYDDGDHEERVAPRFIKVIARLKPFKILPLPLGKGDSPAKKDINERRTILTTWAKLIVEILGSATMLLLDKPLLIRARVPLASPWKRGLTSFMRSLAPKKHWTEGSSQCHSPRGLVS
jgi:hypothetical protein